MNGFKRTLTIIGLSLTVLVGSTTPSQAFAPAVFLVPAIATVITGVAGASAASESNVLSVIAVGAYYAWSLLGDKIVNIVSPYSSGSNAQPISLPVSDTTDNGYRRKFFTDVTLVGTTHTRDISIGWGSRTYTLFGGAAFVGSSPLISTGLWPRLTIEGATDIWGTCGITYKIVSTGAVVTSIPNGAGSIGFNPGQPAAAPNQVNVSYPACNEDIQNLITAQQVNNTTKILVGFFVSGIYTSLVPSAPISHVLTGLATQTIQAITTCKNSSGTILNIAGSVLNLTGSTSSVTVKGCPSGYYLFSQKIESSNGIAKQKLYEIGQKSSTAGTYPLCAGIAKCELQVRYKTVACTDNLGACTYWYRNAILAPIDFTCYWGTYLVTIADCSPLIYQYDVNAVRDVEGVAVSSQTIAPAPSTSSGTSPTNDGSLTTSTATDDGFFGCAPTGWGLLNPLAYVGATGCIVKWAFIPPPNVLPEALTLVKTSWATSNAGVFTDAMTSIPLKLLPLAGSGAVNCQGPGFNMKLGNLVPERMTYFLDACSSPMSGVASTTKLLGTIFIGFGGMVVVWNIFAGAVGLTRIDFRPQTWQQDTLL